MCRKKLILGSLIVVLTMAVVLTSVSFSFNILQVSGSFVSKAAVPVSRDSLDMAVITANTQVAAIQGSVIEDVEKSLSNAVKDIHRDNIAAIKAREATIQLPAVGANLSSMEAEIVRLINKVRADHGLVQLQVSQSLTDIARTRTNDMLAKNYFSHHAPDGSTFFNILRNCNISYMNGGENLGNATPANCGSPGAFLNAWLNSPSHRDNMLRSHYRMVGIGISDSGGRRVVTTIFLN